MSRPPGDLGLPGRGAAVLRTEVDVMGTARKWARRVVLLTVLLVCGIFLPSLRAPLRPTNIIPAAIVISVVVFLAGRLVDWGSALYRLCSLRKRGK